MLFDISLLLVFDDSFGDVKRFSPESFLNRRSRFYTELSCDVIKEVVIVVVHWYYWLVAVFSKKKFTIFPGFYQVRCL